MRWRDFITVLAGATPWMSAARGQEPRHLIGHLSGRSDAVPGAIHFGSGRGDRLRRRDFITVFAGATAWISAAGAQEPRRVIGILSSMSYGSYPGTEVAFAKGLEDTGFTADRNTSIEWRWAEGQYDRLPSLAGELVRRGVAVIVGFDGPASFAAKAATTTIPIVFVTGADPVKTGFVDSFSRPGGNLSGVSILYGSLGQKHVELLRELLPAASAIGVLVNPGNQNVHAYQAEIEVAANAFRQRWKY
jgi:putative tryptophan/tyrosine transport system substrate-binding protein